MRKPSLFPKIRMEILWEIIYFVLSSNRHFGSYFSNYKKLLKKYLTRLCYFKYADTFFAIEMICFGESEDILDFFVPRPELQYIHTPELDTHSKRLHFIRARLTQVSTSHCHWYLSPFPLLCQLHAASSNRDQSLMDTQLSAG